MDVSTLIDELDQQGSALAAAIDRAGLDATVPSCPGWDVRSLVGHVGMVHRWATAIVSGAPDAQRNSDFPAPNDGVREWFEAGYRDLVDALRTAPPERDIWSFFPATSPLAFWARRQAHETAIHRADAESAMGWVPEYDPDFAADGIGELLEGFYARKRGPLVADPPFSLRILPLDANVSWVIEVGPVGRQITRDGTAVVDCTLTGSSADLYLDLWNREPSGSVALSGDGRAMEIWRKLAHVTWN